ncbi:MAG: uncharacterized protein QOD09_603 [Bradyrhizobium sp.]|jgi:uncharacterized membrane protein YecN with MAPEG domain|nr:uncharacterized protein [Bradyrhizobium sp.]
MKNAAPRPDTLIQTRNNAIKGNRMQMPSITGFYLALLALLYAALALQVARLRRGNRVLFGDGENIRLRSAIRAHANFVEYVPIVALLVATLEMSGLSAIWVHVLMGALLAARLLHPLGMYSKPGTWQFSAGRVGGIVITISVLIAAALFALARFSSTIGGH